jgi:hypothetical protein
MSPISRAKLLGTHRCPVSKILGGAAASEVRKHQRFPLRLDGSVCDPSRSAESHVLKKIWLKSKDRS